MADNGRVISADGHLEVLPERWTDRVPQKYRDRAPRTVELPNGGQAQMIEGRPLQEAFFLDLRAGRPDGEWQPTGLRVEDSAGTGPPEQRLKEQDADGMSAEILYPAMVSGPGLWRSIRHDDVYKSMVRAYNDWLGEEYAPMKPQTGLVHHGSPALDGRGRLHRGDGALCQAGPERRHAGHLPQRQGLPHCRGRQVLGRGLGHEHAPHGPCAVRPFRAAGQRPHLPLPK